MTLIDERRPTEIEATTAQIVAVPPAAATPTARSSRFRADIEGLRAVAVILVVLYHAGVSILGGGYVGVDVFFVISGFLITSLLVREVNQTGRLSLRRFYARRVTRLLPAASLVTVSTVVATWLWLPPLRLSVIGGDAVATTFYGLNYRLAARGIDYLTDGEAPTPLLHFWSLAVEEQFYLVWPLLLLVVALVTRGHRLRRLPVVGVLLAVSAASFAASVTQTSTAAPWAYFGAHTRAWELAVGALVAVLAHQCARLPRSLAWALAGAGLVAIGAAALLFTDATPFPGYAAALPVFGAAAVIVGGCAAPLPPLTNRVAQGIGALSYSWYLWHWPVLVIAPFVLGHTPSLLVRLLLVAGALVAAMFTYVIVEDPIRGQRLLRQRPWRAAGVGLTATGAVFASVLVVPHLSLTGGSAHAPTVDTPALTAAGATTMGAASSAAQQLAAVVSASAAMTAAPANLTPSLTVAGRDFPVMYKDLCDPPLTDSTVRMPCAYGEVGAATTVVLFGDSHAAQWFGAMDTLAKQRHWRLVVVTKSACSAASVLIRHNTLKRDYTECVQWRTKALDYVASLHPALVVVSSNGDGGMIVNTPIDARSQSAAWVSGWVTTVRRLKTLAGRVVTISDTPWPNGNVPECVSAHVADVRPCGRSLDQAVPARPRRDAVAKAVAAEGVKVIDPLSWFCTARICPPIVGNTLVYRDASHLTNTYSITLAPLLSEQLS